MFKEEKIINSTVRIVKKQKMYIIINLRKEKNMNQEKIGNFILELRKKKI